MKRADLNRSKALFFLAAIVDSPAATVQDFAAQLIHGCLLIEIAAQSFIDSGCRQV